MKTDKVKTADNRASNGKEVNKSNDRNMPKTMDEYISAFPPDVRQILERIRRVIHEVAPAAQEVISYRMPAFKLNGIVVYFAAWRNHIGLYPPISGDAQLEKAIAPYAGEKGNLQFPLDRPIPYDLIERIARFRVERNLAKSSRGRGSSGVKTKG